MCAAMSGGPIPTAQVRASRVPGPDEDKEVAHAAFLNAYGNTHQGPRIKGMQEFAGAVSEESREVQAGSLHSSADLHRLDCCW